MKKLNEISIGFFGTPNFSLNFLKDLYENHVNISFVVSQPPRRSGRGKALNSSPVHKWARQNNIKVLTPKDSNNESFLNTISENKVDFNIVVAYGKILNKELISLPRFLSLNVHASLLPRWRGAAPIQRAILSNDQKTGVCIMRVDEKLDSGPIILEKQIKIDQSDNFGSIYDKISNYGKSILKEAMIRIVNDDYKLKYQNEKFACYADKINKSECKIEWSNNALEINSKIRAFSPFPGAWTTFRNTDLRIKILEASVIDKNKIEKNKNYKVGQITENFTVKCANDFLKIKTLQKEGKKPISAKEFLNGNKIEDFSFS